MDTTDAISTTGSKTSSSRRSAKRRWGRILTGLAVLIGLAVAGVAWAVSAYGHFIGIWWPAPSVATYGDKALRLMDQGVHADTEEWTVARADATSRIASATTHDEVDAILRDVVKVAGGGHSFIVSEENMDAALNDYVAPTTMRDGCILTLTLPGYIGAPEQGRVYATTVADALTPDVCGVVLDLRGDDGGDMGPMIAGLTPLLPDGVVTSFKLTNGMTTDVTVTEGKTQGGGTPTDVGRRTELHVPVAILTSEETASSGEQTLLAFRGLDDVRVFGQPTAGYITVNRLFPLYTGRTLALSLGTTLARTGEEFSEDPIAPDEIVPLDEAPAVAAEWIGSQK